LIEKMPCVSLIMNGLVKQAVLPIWLDGFVSKKFDQEGLMQMITRFGEVKRSDREGLMQMIIRFDEVKF